jgi:hypothetical protein
MPVVWKRSCITAWESASAYAYFAGTACVQAASQSSGGDVTTQNDGAAPGQVSGKVPGGVSGNTDAGKPAKKFTSVKILIIVAIAVGAALLLCIILSLVIWKCRSSGTRRRRESTQGNANGMAPAIPYT